LFLVNATLVGCGWFYTLCFFAQLVFYGLAVAAHFNPRVKDNGVARIIYFFVQANVAIADASCRYLAGKRMTTWQPSTR